MAQPGRNLDIYITDINRVEVLAGPQGTLFGASSQAGVVRLITNKPDPSGFYGRVQAGVDHDGWRSQLQRERDAEHPCQR